LAVGCRTASYYVNLIADAIFVINYHSNLQRSNDATETTRGNSARVAGGRGQRNAFVEAVVKPAAAPPTRARPLSGRAGGIATVARATDMAISTVTA
jgi:hypothetical protein